MFDFTHIISLDPAVDLQHNCLHEKHLIDKNHASRLIRGKHFNSETFIHTDILEEGFSRRGSIFAFLVGKAYTNSHYALQNNISASSLNASALLDMYITHGEDLIRSIKGIFVIFIADEDRNVYLGYTSRSGLLKLYYYLGRNRLILSTSVASILNNLDQKPKLDEVAILQHGLFEHPLGDRTHFNDIKILDNFSYLKHDLARTQIKPFFDLSRSLSERPSLTWKDTYALSPGIFNKVMDLIVPETSFNSALTGGYDSRTILSYLLCKPKLDFQLYSWAADDRWPDVAVAKMITERFGLNYQPIELGNEMFDLYPVLADQHVYWTDGLGSINRTNQMYSHAVLAKHSRFTITGYFGSEILRPLSRQNIMINAEFIDVLFSKDRHIWLAGNIVKLHNRSAFQEQFLSRHKEELAESIHQYFASIDGEMSLSMKKFFYVLKSGFWKFFGQEFHAQRVNCCILSPYIDDDFIDFILTTPVIDIHKGNYRRNLNDILKGQAFYHPIMKANCPALMDIKTNRGFSPKDFESFLYPVNVFAKFYLNKRQHRKAKIKGFDSSSWNKLAYAAYPETVAQDNSVFKPLTAELLKTGFWFSLKRHIQSQS